MPAVAAPQPAVVPEPITPQPATPPEPQPVPQPKKRSWLKWLLIVLGILLLAAVVLFLCCKCSTAEKVADLPTQLPDVNENNVVLSSDSLRYQVNDRLNIMVLSGGTLDEFIARFRKIYPDKNKYQFCSPDTAMGYVLLMVPPEEREALIEEIPQKMKPDFDVLVTPDNMHGGCYVPNDPAMQSQAESYYFAEVNAPEAWDVEKGKADVVVAVLDDGFDVAHPELQGKVVKPYDAVREASTVLPSGDGHGQHTAGTAVGRSDNGQGACGIAPGCSLMPVNVFYNNGASDSAVIKGLIYAVNNGAKVINLSLGPSFYGCKFMPIEQQQIVAQSSFLQEAQMWDKLYEKIENAGVTVTKAAGNDTVLAAMDPMNRSQHIIVVSAVDSAGDMAIFDFMQGSNYGDACDISAPGVNIYNSVPGNRYEAMSGTSMAAPQVAGGAALLYSHFPGITPKQVKEILVGTAVPTDEYVGPLMDLQAALAADPSDPSTYANPRQEASDPVRGRQPSTQADPYYDYYLVIINNPDREADELFDAPDTDTNPRYNPAPGSGSGNSCGDYDAALAEYKRIMQQLQDLRRRYPGCFS